MHGSSSFTSQHDRLEGFFWQTQQQPSVTCCNCPLRVSEVVPGTSCECQTKRCTGTSCSPNRGSLRSRVDNSTTLLQQPLTVKHSFFWENCFPLACFGDTWQTRYVLSRVLHVELNNLFVKTSHRPAGLCPWKVGVKLDLQSCNHARNTCTRTKSYPFSKQTFCP